MKVTQKKLDGGKIMLEAVATPAEVDKALHQAQIQFAMQMGLRPVKDKTIAEVCEEQMGIRDLDSVVESSAVEYLLPFAMDKRNITPAFPPQALPSSSLKRGREFAFRLTVTPKPNYELKSYDPVDVTLPKFTPDETGVQEQLDELADRYATYDTDEPHVVEKGNHVLIAIEAKQDGEVIPGLTTEGRTYTTGVGYMPEGFDENVIGMNVGETKSFTFEGPGFDDEGNPTTEVVECTVTVREMQKKVIPAITDEWVKTYMPMYRSAEELRKDISNSLNAQRKAQYDDYVRGMVAQKMSERFEGRIEDAVYESMRDNIMKDLRRNLEQQNMSMEEFVEQNGGQNMFDMQLMMQTRQNLIQGYSLDAVFRHEGLVVSDSDIDAVCKMLNPRDPLSVRREMEQTGRNFALREIVERYCANNWLVEHANITYQEDIAPAEGESAAEAPVEAPAEVEAPEEKAE